MDRSINIQMWLPIPKDITSDLDPPSKVIIDTTTEVMVDITTNFIIDTTTIKQTEIVTIQFSTPTVESAERLLQWKSDTTRPREWSQPSAESATVITIEITIVIDIMIAIIVKSISMPLTPGNNRCFQVWLSLQISKYLFFLCLKLWRFRIGSLLVT